MQTNNKKVSSGFTLIEILVAIALIAIMATVVIPNLRPRDPVKERQSFIARLNALTRMAWHGTLSTGKTHQIFVDLEQRKVQLKIDTGKTDSQADPIFEPVKGSFINTALTWPKNLEIKNFAIEGYDEMERTGPAGKLWFFVVPGGLAQAVTINMIDSNDKVGGRARTVGLVLNPFSAQFKTYDTFQK